VKRKEKGGVEVSESVARRPMQREEEKTAPESFRIQSRDVLNRTKKLALKELQSLEDGFGDGDESADGSVDAS